jgi:hypothetical protein
MKKLFSLWMLFASMFMAQCLMAQQEAQVPGLKTDEVWNIVYKVLNDNNLAVAASRLPGSVESDYKEYSSGLFKNRAKLVFTYQNETLTISLKNRQTLSSNSWADAVIPSKKADDKLIGIFIEKIKAIANNPEEVAKLNTRVAPGGSATAAAGGAMGAVQGQTQGAAKKPSLANAKEVRFDNCENYIFTEGLCALKKNDLWGFIDTTGKVLVDFIYFPYGGGVVNPKYSCGMALVAIQGPSGYGRVPVYIDKKGVQLFKTQFFTGATDFESGIAIVERTNNKTMARSVRFINKQGLDIPGSINFGQVFGSFSLKLEPFHEGLTKLYDTKTSSYGFINTQGKWVVNPTNYAEAGFFSEGLVFVQNNTNWTWGYINAKGEVKIPFDYKNKPGRFSEGLAVAQNSKDELGYIDQTGKTALPFIYNHYQLNSEFRNGCAVIYNDNGGGYAIIDKSGKIVRKLNTTVVSVLRNGWILWKEDLGTGSSYCFGVLSPEGKDILAPGYFTQIGEFSNGLAYATAKIDEKEVKGFINQNFDFVIIQTY